MNASSSTVAMGNGMNEPALSGAGNDRDLASFIEETDRESPMTQYLQVLLRRRWIVLGGVLLGLLAALYSTLTTTRLYRSTATIEILREASKVVDLKGTEPSSNVGSQEFYQTQYGLLRSRALAEQVVRKLRLDDNDILLYGYTGATPDASTVANRAAVRKQMLTRATSLVQRNLTITPLRNSGLVSVSFDSPDAELSRRVANSVVESFIESSLARRFDASAYARRFLEERLAQTRAKLEESERALVSYASRERIVTLDAPAQAGDQPGRSQGQSLAGADLATLNNALGVAKAERIAAEARFGQARRGGGMALSESTQDSSISALRAARAQLSGEYSKQLARFKPDYPSMVALRQQIQEIDRQLGSQANGIVNNVRSEFQAAVQREQTLQRQVDGLKDNVLDLRSRSIQYNIFQRDADTNRVLYDGLLQRYKEIGIAGGVGTNNVSMVDPAMAASNPFTPQTGTNLLLGLLAGLFGGALLAFLIEQLDESIVAPHDLEKKLGVPLLGSIPRVADGETALDKLEDRKSPVSEAYISVQTSLRFATSHGTPRSLLLTSAKASEGKSTSSISLAKNFAMLGRKVVLVDGDMRNPSVHKLFGLANKAGLSDALAGSDDVAKLIHKQGDSSLSIITSGPIPPNPAELLAGPRLGQFIEKLLETYDQVVIDGPPIMGLADAPLIASSVEGTIFVIAAVETRARAARVALRRLVDVHARIAGAILTKFDAKQVGYDYGYSYDYGETRSTVGKMLGR
jgi:polysaccharide biosynthesis transport protein